MSTILFIFKVDILIITDINRETFVNDFFKKVIQTFMEYYQINKLLGFLIGFSKVFSRELLEPNKNTSH